MLFHNVSLATNPQVTFKNSRCPTVGIFAAVLWEIMKVQLSSKKKKKKKRTYLIPIGISLSYCNKKGNVKTAVDCIYALHLLEVQIAKISSNL